MKRLGVIFLIILLALGVFWIGLMWNFPGASVSRYVERRVNRAQGFDLVLTPAELRWNRLYVQRAELRRRNNPAALALFVLTDFSIPLTWRLVRGLHVRALIGKQGRVEAFLPWRTGEDAWLQGNLKMDEVPILEVFRPIAVSGALSFSGHFKMDAEARTGSRLPDGLLEGEAEALEITGVTVAGNTLPPTRMDSLRIALQTGRTVNVSSFQFSGDLQGRVEGTITPNLRNPRNSLLALRITTAFRDNWLARLGNLRPAVESFMDKGRLAVRLDGTIGRPRLRPVRGGG